MDRTICPIHRAPTNDSIGAKADKMKEESGTRTTIIYIKLTPTCGAVRCSRRKNAKQTLPKGVGIVTDGFGRESKRHKIWQYPEEE
jgi:hypothetical protein